MVASWFVTRFETETNKVIHRSSCTWTSLTLGRWEEAEFSKDVNNLLGKEGKEGLDEGDELSKPVSTDDAFNVGEELGQKVERRLADFTGLGQFVDNLEQEREELSEDVLLGGQSLKNKNSKL